MNVGDIMKTLRSVTRAIRPRLLALVVCALLPAALHAQTLGETPEVVYLDDSARSLREKAAELGSAVSIYEHLHNTIEYVPYHGSRSGSVNTYMGKRGSDVDIASTVVAMLRSQNIPARYAVGTIRLPAAQFVNWIGVASLEVALQILKDQGIQGIVLASDRSTVNFEHAWAEALVPFDQYRGINAVLPAVDCAQSAARCTWVPLDASFKQKNYNGLNLDPYNAVAFDYAAYYNAIKNNDKDRRDKNPLTILEDQVGGWLRANHAGKTLADVRDAGKIIELSQGLLPASLPYQVVGNIRRYDTVAAHDGAVPSAEAKKWGKTVQVTVKFDHPGGTHQSVGTPLLLASISTKSLGISTEFIGYAGAPNMILRLHGQEVFRPITENTVPGYTPQLGAPFVISLSMDGAPGIVGGEPDRIISADYSGVIGGYYLIATGGETSNWSQVHRAADDLLLNGDSYARFYSPVFNPGEPGCQPDGAGCTPYEDLNGNGWDPSDPQLLHNSLAMEILTSGLLNLAATQYYAKLREHMERADALMKTKSPILGYLGVVSTTYEVEYVDSTAYSILPGGLLIDVKGVTLGGNYRAGDPQANVSNRQFEFFAHMASSLEHEIWQEITGYDAVSTVRGIQMALANGAELLSLKANTTQNTLPALYPSLGFSLGTPPGFTHVPFTIFNTAPSTWTHSSSGAEFETLLATVNSSTSALRAASPVYTYYPSGGLYGFSRCVSDLIAEINSLPNGSYSFTTCLSQSYTNQTKAQMLTIVSNEWGNVIVPVYFGQPYFDYFDRNKGFSPAGQAYRALPVATDQHDIEFIADIREDMQVRNLAQDWIEYVLPSRLTMGSSYRFSVNVRKGYLTSDNRLTSMSMSIANRNLSAGGGYVDFIRTDRSSGSWTNSEE